jgi:hypothetical protein
MSKILKKISLVLDIRLILSALLGFPAGVYLGKLLMSLF